jgi:flagellar M-ring protein FliF
MMDDVLGVGKSVIRLTADLNFQQIERTTENFDPNTPSIRSEERISSNNAIMDRSDETAESNEENKSETVITNYELNKSVEHIVNALGTIDRLSVAVMVDGIYSAVENENGVIEMIYQPRPQEELDRLAAIVRNTVGFDAQRNDQIEMVNIAFDRQSLDGDQQLLDSMYTREFYMDIAKKILYVLLILGLLLYAKKKSSKLFAVLGKLVPPPVARTVVVNAPSDQEAQQEPVEPAMPEKRQPKLVDKMQETARKEPEEIAKVIKTMMIE